MFRLKLSEEARERIARERAEVLRLFALTDQWLATAVLKLARNARMGTGLSPDMPTYDARLVWGIAPELARRLGRVKLEIAEIDWEIRELSDYELRCWIGSTLDNVSSRGSQAWALLTRTPVNGNPIVFAIDRLHAGQVDDKQDRLTAGMAEVARYRGVPFAGVSTRELISS